MENKVEKLKQILNEKHPNEFNFDNLRITTIGNILSFKKLFTGEVSLNRIVDCDKQLTTTLEELIEGKLETTLKEYNKGIYLVESFINYNYKF